MDAASIELPGTEIASISLEEYTLIIRFSRAYIVKTMTGSVEKTRWWQAGELIFHRAEVTQPMPQGPLVCTGGDVGENVFTYRDMIPIPLESRGRTHCDLTFAGTDLHLQALAETVQLSMVDVPKYIEHIRPE